MPTEHQFKWFGIVMAVVCIPFFLLIGSLNTTSGMEFWRKKWHQVLAWITRNPMPVVPTDEDDENNANKVIQGNTIATSRWLSRIDCLGTGHVKKKPRSQSVSEAMRIRLAQTKPLHISPASTLHNDRSAQPTTSSRAGAKNIDITAGVGVSDPISSESSRMKAATEVITSASSSEKAGNARLETVPTASWWELFMKRKRHEKEREHDV